MQAKQKKIALTLQILLWMWFGTVSSFTAVNTANILKLELKNASLRYNVNNLERRLLLVKYQMASGENKCR